jgi:hypothetical protein
MQDRIKGNCGPECGAYGCAAAQINVINSQVIIMHRYRVTQETFGLGFSSSTHMTQRVEQHITSHASEGWELIQADKSGWEMPITWRFIWKLPNEEQL